MRILYFSDTFLPEINGVTTVLATMRDGFRPAVTKSGWWSRHRHSERG
jgi:hypothetical protein